MLFLCPSDHSVAPEVLEQLEGLVLGRLRGRIRDFHLLSSDDGLVLQGRARTYYVKQLVQSELMALCDYPIAANEIEVA
jgi:hypothetical protein